MSVHTPAPVRVFVCVCGWAVFTLIALLKRVYVKPLLCAGRHRTSVFTSGIAL